MWSSGGNHLTDAELHEKDTHLLIFFGICYCAFFIWLFCCPIPVWGTPIIKKGAIVYPPYSGSRTRQCAIMNSSLLTV